MLLLTVKNTVYEVLFILSYSYADFCSGVEELIKLMMNETMSSSTGSVETIDILESNSGSLERVCTHPSVVVVTYFESPFTTTLIYILLRYGSLLESLRHIIQFLDVKHSRVSIMTEISKDLQLPLYEPKMYSKLDIFFCISEFFFGIVTQEIDLLFKVLPGGDKHTYAPIHRYVFPFVIFLCLYLTDSYVGKLVAVHVACFCGVVLQIIIIILQATRQPHDAALFRLLMTLVGDVLRPVRWAVMYSTKPLKPFKVIRRFVILTEVSFLLGTASMNAVKLFALSRYTAHHHLDKIIPVSIMIKLIVYPFFVYCIYKGVLHCPKYFKLFSVESAVRDVSYVMRKKIFRKTRIKFREPRKARNQDLGVSIIVVLAVFTPYTTAMLDHEVIRMFSMLNRDFLMDKNLTGALATIIPAITMLTFLLIEFGVLRLARNSRRWQPFYLTWMTYCFIIIIIALLMMSYIYMMLEREMPFPKVPAGKAHMTVFNCLPATIEIEWPHLGTVDQVRNQDYVRKVLIPLKNGKTETADVVVYNKPTGLYRNFNVTLEEGKENVFVATHDGLIRVTIEEKLAFSRFQNQKAQIRVLDCLEICCHGNISFIPTRPTSKQKPATIALTTNLMSVKYELEEGQYWLAYHPDENTTMQMGAISLKRLDKKVVLIHSIHSPAYRTWDMVTLSKRNSAVFIPMLIFVGVFGIYQAFQKIAILMKTKPEIYSSMFGFLITMNNLGAFGAVAFFNQDDLETKSFFMLLGGSMFALVLYLAVVLKLKNHFRVEDVTQTTQTKEKIRPRDTSATSVVTNATTGTTESPSSAKVKNN